ncbi:MAG: efflux transporter outer membrane subunit [Bdellovibrionales bacterium]|nr:efflux transporter outer membrane subunit [Bdellovibrionales bacterium]
MKSKNLNSMILFVAALLFITGCVPNTQLVREEGEIQRELPNQFPDYKVPLSKGEEELIDYSKPDDNAIPKEDNGQVTKIKAPLVEKPSDTPWEDFFSDVNLKNLVAEALKNNQELNIISQEINISKNEMMARQGEYLPKLGFKGENGIEKVGHYTHRGATDSTTEYEPGKFVPEDLKNYSVGLTFSWEIDIWKKLRNATKSALYSYLASIDGKNFMVTNLVAEIASTYYELLALDSELEIVNTNLEIQEKALKLVKLQKQAARVTSLAVKRFEAEVLKNQSRRFELRQKIIQMENKLNMLAGRYPQPVQRNAKMFLEIMPQNLADSIPSNLLERRPDVRQAQNRLKAANLDIKVAKARFYPSLSIEAGVGYESFNSKHLFMSPESVFYNLAGNLTAPLLNRQAIKADYLSANAKQVQAVFEYEQTLIRAFTEVTNQMAKIENYKRSYRLKLKQVEALNDSVEISNVLFKAARADYVEVLMTRRDALESQIELVEIKRKLLDSFVTLYQSLGGGWTKDETLTE